MFLKAIFRLTSISANRLWIIAFITFILFLLIALPLWLSFAFEEDHFASALAFLFGFDLWIVYGLAIILHSVNSTLLYSIKVRV
jgi:hypothetical protein